MIGLGYVASSKMILQRQLKITTKWKKADIKAIRSSLGQLVLVLICAITLQTVGYAFDAIIPPSGCSIVLTRWYLDLQWLSWRTCSTLWILAIASSKHSAALPLDHADPALHKILSCLFPYCLHILDLVFKLCQLYGASLVAYRRTGRHDLTGSTYEIA